MEICDCFREKIVQKLMKNDSGTINTKESLVATAGKLSNIENKLKN